MNLMLNRIRLTWFFAFFFVLFFVLLGYLPRHKFDSTALTLFSVNSFLYGFFITPILNAQKARIEELHRIVRAEANVIFTIMLSTKKLSKELRKDLQTLFSMYVTQSTRNHRNAAEKTYQNIISFCVDYDGKERAEVDKVLEKVVANQQNRTNLSMQLNNRIYSNEWLIMFVLFSITISFILLLDNGSSVLLRVVTSMLCTGLTMLVVILVKYSSLTHKKAKQIWNPFLTLLATKYYRINESGADDA